MARAAQPRREAAAISGRRAVRPIWSRLLVGQGARRRHEDGFRAAGTSALSFHSRPSGLHQSSYWRGRIVTQSIDWQESRMSSLDFELDSRIDDLELEWRQAQEASMVARAEHRALAADPGTNAAAIVLVRERLRRAEAWEGRTFSKIE